MTTWLIKRFVIISVFVRIYISPNPVKVEKIHKSTTVTGAACINTCHLFSYTNKQPMYYIINHIVYDPLIFVYYIIFLQNDKLLYLTVYIKVVYYRTSLLHAVSHETAHFSIFRYNGWLLSYLFASCCTFKYIFIYHSYTTISTKYSIQILLRMDVKYLNRKQ